MRAIEGVLGPALGDRSTRFVFPSEICAGFWLRRAAAGGLAAAGGGPRALEASRFLGWDSFKEAAFGQEGGRPADSLFRTIFAARLLADNAERPFLAAILPPERAAGWEPFVAHVASRLPSLRSLSEAADRARKSPEVADWLEIHRRYAAFLEAKGRYEPSYRGRGSPRLEGRYAIFFPSLVEDFEEYRAALVRCPEVSLVDLPPPEAPYRLSSPATSLGEIRDALREIGALLDGGLAAGDIAITVAGLDGYRPFLEREAELLSVPLAFRSGSPLSSTPGGALFSAIGEAASSGFAYDALRDLHSSPAWPWLYPGRNRDLLAAGARLHAIAPWPEGGAMVDPWERGLAESGRGGDSDLLAAYRALKRAASAIAGARDFAALRSAFAAFRGEWLAKEGWSELSDLTLARCVVELGKLAAAQEELEVELPRPFALFLRHLESTRYVPPGSSGVGVYEWRVAAGIAPERHFVLRAAQDALSVPLRRFDFLPEATRRELGAEDLDAGPAFIAAYAASGRSVTFSCPAKGFAGELAPHGSLVSKSSEEPSEGGPPPIGPLDAYSAEAAWLLGEGPVPERLNAAQLAGIAAALEAPPSAPEPRSGERGAFLSAPAAAKAAGRLRARGEGRLRLNATALDAYSSCPYAFLYLRLLGAGAESSGIAFLDDLFMGEVYHAALESLFARIGEEDGRFRPERRADYASWIPKALEEAAARLAEKRGPFVPVVLESYRARLASYLGQVLEAEAERFPGLEVGPLEASLEAEYPDLDTSPFPGGLVLDGRIDRVSLREGKAVIVDYKKGRLPSKADAAPGEDGNLAASQLPCYLKLASRAAGGGTPWSGLDSAWYVSIEGWDKREPGSAHCAFGDYEGAWIPPESLAGLMGRLDGLVASTAAGILAGSFPVVEKESQGRACEGCGARGICRERYAIRLG